MALLALGAHTTVLAYSLPTALLASIALTAVLADMMTHRTPCTECAHDRARIFVTPPHSLHRERRRPCSHIVTHRTPCTESARRPCSHIPAHRTPCTQSADDRARRLMPHRTPCTESADDRARRLMPTALLAVRAPTTVRTSAAHLAVRAVLHPVLARPVVPRGSLPLRALLGRLVSPILVSIGTVDIRNCNPHAWPPHRRHPSLAPREV